MRKTISLAPDIYAKALAIAKRRGFAKSFSAYMSWLIERDSEGQVKSEMLHTEAPPGYGSHLRVAEDQEKK
ncbi:MAG TPA: hypothetical protein VK474_11600 [Chthoniobacterales bacterium]|nr:hypothetical protein [Chthoniobacterales bacterium]